MKKLVVLVFVSSLLVGCVDRQAQQQARETEQLIKDQTTSVEVMSVSQTTVADTLDLTGSIETSDEVDVTAIVGGALIAVSVKDGDQVTAGQVIARQDDGSFRAQLENARAQARAALSSLEQARTDALIGPQKSAAQILASQARLDQARARLQRLINGARPEEKAQAAAEVERAKSDMETARLARDRAQRLFNEGAIPKADLERAVNAYAAALAAYDSALAAQRLVQAQSRPEDIAAAEQDVRAAEQQLAIDQANKRLDVLYTQRVESAQASYEAAKQTQQLAEIALDNTVVRAPFSGRISGKPLQPGTYVAPGVSIAKIVGTGGAYFEAEVPESQVSLVSPGMKVDVTIDALPGVTTTGTLVAVSPQATGAGRLFFARVRLDSIPEGLRAGMFSRGVAVLGERSGVILLPSEAVLRDGEQAYVYIAQGDKAVRIDVTTGVTRNGATEVIGLTEGDRVIVKGQTTIANDAPIKVVERTSGGE